MVLVIKFNDAIYNKLNAIFGSQLIMFVLPNREYIKNIKLVPGPRFVDPELETSTIGDSVQLHYPHRKVYAYNTTADSKIHFIDQSEAKDWICIVIPEWAYNLFSNADEITVLEIRSDLVFQWYEDLE